MKTLGTLRGRIPTFALVGGLALFGALSVGGATQALLAGPVVQDVSDDSGSESKPKPKPDCGRVCEK